MTPGPYEAVTGNEAYGGPCGAVNGSAQATQRSHEATSGSPDAYSAQPKRAMKQPMAVLMYTLGATSGRPDGTHEP